VGEYSLSHHSHRTLTANHKLRRSRRPGVDPS
jgi:hypothetical protein